MRSIPPRVAHRQAPPYVTCGGKYSTAGVPKCRTGVPRACEDDSEWRDLFAHDVLANNGFRANPYDEVDKAGMAGMRRETRVVINLLYKDSGRAWDKGAVRRKIESEMRSLSDDERTIKAVICIFPDGSIIHL